MVNSAQARRSYIPLRGTAAAISLLLAVWYSRDLGIINRSYLAVIMVTCSLCVITFTSGTTFTLRAQKSNHLPRYLRTSFSACIILELLISFSFFLVSLMAFSAVKEKLPANLVVIASIYFICAFFHNTFMEYLLSLDRFGSASKLELSTVLLQVVSFFLMSKFFPLSIASSVLLSFAASYLSILIYIASTTPVREFFGFSNPRVFWVLTSGNHLLGTVLGALDRMDRVLIAFFLPTVNLGQYAAMGSLLSYFRFLPEALSKIIVSGPINRQFRLLKNKYITGISLVFFFSFVILFSRLFIEIALGSEWLLSIWVYVSFAVYEIARGWFQVLYNRNLSQRLVPSYWILVNLVFICLIFSMFAVSMLGLVGVPLAFGLGYLVSLKALK